MAEDFVAMPFRREADLPAGPLLDLLELGPAHLLDPPAFYTDQVVMVRPLMAQFVVRVASGAGHGFDQVGFLEHLEGSEDSRPADPVFAQTLVKVFLAEVTVGVQEAVDKARPLFGEPQAVRSKVLGEDGPDSG